MGADVEALLDGAQVAAEGCRPDDPGEHNSGLWLGATLGELALRGRDKLTFVVDDPEIASVGLWLEQLVAESTGKHGKGILPVADEPVGAPEVYGDDRVFVHLRGEGAELDEEMQRPRARRPRGASRSTPQGAKDLGRIFFFAEFATAVAGWALGDQPVRPAQRAGGQGQHEARARGRARRTIPTGIGRATRSRASRRRSYVAILAYAPPSDGARRSASPSCARADPRRDEGDDDVRLRPALPALDRPVPQGRPADRRCSSSSSTARGRRRARGGRSRSARCAAQAVGDLRDAAASHGAEGASGVEAR